MTVDTFSIVVVDVFEIRGQLAAFDGASDFVHLVDAGLVDGVDGMFEMRMVESRDFVQRQTRLRRILGRCLRVCEEKRF